MAVAKSIEFDVNSLKALLKSLRDIQSDFDSMTDDLESALDIKKKGILDLQKAFKGLKKIIVTSLVGPLTAANSVVGKIQSTFRSIAMSPLGSMFGGVVDKLKNAIKGMFDFAREQTASWWDAQVMGTSTKNLMAIESTDRAFGTGGALKSLSESFSQAINDFSKHGGLLATSGATNADLARWQKMDKVDALLEYLQKYSNHAMAQGRNPLTKAYYEQVGGGDALGADFEVMHTILKNFKDLAPFLKEQKAAIRTSDKSMLNVSKTSERLNTAFHNIKVMLTERFAPAVTRLLNTLAPVINDIAKELLTDKNMKEFSNFLKELANQLKDFLKNGGIKKLKEWASTLAYVFGEVVYFMAKGLNKINIIDDENFYKLFKDKVERDKYNSMLGSSRMKLNYGLGSLAMPKGGDRSDYAMNAVKLLDPALLQNYSVDSRKLYEGLKAHDMLEHKVTKDSLVIKLGNIKTRQVIQTIDIKFNAESSGG